MSFRNLNLANDVTTVIQLKPAEEPHTKAVDYSGNRIKQLGGIPTELMAGYRGEQCVAVVDTETTCETGDNFGKPLIYDVGVTYVRKSDGVPVGKSCFIIKDVFTNAKLMKGAYFTNRVFTDYPFILTNGTANFVTFREMLEHLQQQFKHFNVDTFAAYNSSFDTKAFDKTCEYIERVTSAECNFGLVADIRNGTIDVLDLWAFSCMTFMSHDAYKLKALQKHWFTKNGDKFSTNAEAANNFINGSEVGEDHTALSDTAIEAGIYKFCLAQPEASDIMQICLNGHGETWSYVNNRGSDSVHAWVSQFHPDKLADYEQLAAELAQQ